MLNEKQVSLFLLAVENLQKPLGDWTDEAKIDHLTSNAKLAVKYLLEALDANDNINSEGINNQGEQVYATIRPGTKYENQCDGTPFPVRFSLESDGFHWQGGLGGRYRISDLYLYKKVDGAFKSYTTFHHDEPMQIIDFTFNSWKAKADKGEINPDWIKPYSEKLTKQLKTIETQADKTYPKYDEEDESHV